MNTPYQSIYDEAISDRVLQKVGSRKFSALDKKPSETELQSIKSVIDKLTILKKELFILLKKSKTQFKSLDKNVLKLKLKDDTYYKSYKQSLWSNDISSNYSDNIADVIFPGAFGKTIQEIQSKVEELETTYESFNYRNYKSKIPKELTRDYLLAYLNLDNTSNFDKGLRKGIRLGITPANYDGFYRLHMVNSPPDAFKSATGGIGLGKYLYLAVIHHCGHGFTDGSSDDALKVWNHVVKKRKDIYSFIAQDEIGENYILAISIKVPKQDVLQILNKWIKSKWFTTSGSTNIEKTFFGWLKYRKEKYGDEAIDLLDDGLYDLFKKEIEELNKPVSPVIQKQRINVSNIRIGNLELKATDERNTMTFSDAVRNAPKGYRLPTIEELRIIYANKNRISGFILPEDGFYWYLSSSDYLDDNSLVSILDMYDGEENFNTKIHRQEYLVRYVKDSVVSSNTKPSITLSKIIIEKTKMTFDEAKRKYSDTLLKESDLTEEIKDEIIEFFKNGNNANLLAKNYRFLYFRFWLDEESSLRPNLFKVGKYNPENEDFNYFFNDREAEYYVIRFKNKTSNNSNTSQGNTNPSKIVKTKEEGQVRLPKSIYYNIQWKQDSKIYNWFKAKNLEKNGWRLPTIQELYTICLDNQLSISLKGNTESAFWSNDIKEENIAWGVRFINGKPKVLRGEKNGGKLGVILIKDI